MSVTKKRIAIAGAGPAGMLAIYWLKQDGLEPVCYEKTPSFGGTWNYRDEDVEGVGSVTWTTSTTHSKEMGSLSGKTPKEEYPNYMRHSQVLEMFKDFAEGNDILKHISYNHEVIRISKAEDYEETGRWIVQVRNNVTGEIVKDTFDGVFVCVGHMSYPNTVKFPGMDGFKGKIMHAHSLKKYDEFRNQKVVVVGVGCSGLDAAVEISNVAKQVFLSTRSGTWVYPRVGPNGFPFDSIFVRRPLNFILEHFPIWVASSFMEYFLNRNLNHHLCGLRPKHHLFYKDPSINDFLPGKLITGAVVIRKNIKCFTPKGVVFEGEEQITEIDSVILATGYIWKFPFLDDGILTTEPDGRINLYKCMYPTQLRHPTLSILGFIHPIGGGFPLLEMQCRWAVHLLAGKGSLPSADVMVAEVKRRHEKNVKRFRPSDRISIYVDFISYIDSLASEIGAKPNFLKMAFKDPMLLMACIFGPCLPYQFRLEGPHPWPGARDAILTAQSRMEKPLMGSGCSKKTYTPESRLKTHYFGKYFLAFSTAFFAFLLSYSSLMQ